MPDDGAVVDKKNIGDAMQPFERLALIRANWFVAEIAARGYDGETELGHQQMMQRRVRQHRAKVRVAGRRAFGNLRFEI